MRFPTFMIAILMLLVPSSQALGQKVKEPDFYMVMADCKLVTSAPGNIPLNKNSIGMMDGEPFIASCERIKSKIVCDYYNKEKHVYASVDLKISLDSAPDLWFQNKNGTEHYLIDTVRNLASSVNITYIPPEKKKTGGLLTKTCGGTYMTSSEYQALEEIQKTKKKD